MKMWIIVLVFIAVLVGLVFFLKFDKESIEQSTNVVEKPISENQKEAPIIEGYNYDLALSQECEGIGGTWKYFSDGCRDSCYRQREENVICTTAPEWGCDCGVERCWSWNSSTNSSACEPN